jgi:hypothetical protein
VSLVDKILPNIPGTMCLFFSGWLAANGIGGWGWFLFAYLLILFSSSARQWRDDDGKG